MIPTNLVYQIVGGASILAAVLGGAGYVMFRDNSDTALCSPGGFGDPTSSYCQESWGEKEFGIDLDAEAAAALGAVIGFAGPLAYESWEESKRRAFQT